jgi:hypothetical protein
MIKKLFNLAVFILPAFIFGQTVYNFDVEPDTSFWDFEISESADSTLSYTSLSYITDEVSEGSGAMRIDYSAHNIESWGGYAKVYHYHPDAEMGGAYDWTGYDNLSIDYYNQTAQSEASSVHLRINLSDYAGAPDSSYIGLGEYYYSFQYILDSEPGWNTIDIPLVRNDDWNGAGFNLTGWAGDTEDGELDLHAIGGFHFEFSIGGGGEGNSTNGAIILDNMRLTGYQGNELVIFNGIGYPPALEPFTWGNSQFYVTEGEGYIEGTNALTYVQGDGWTGAGFNMPAQDLETGGEWENDSLRFHMWSETDAPTLRLQFESGDDGKVGLNFTPEAAGGWNHYMFALSDFVDFDGTTNFNRSAVTVFQVLGEDGNGVAGRTFHFDDMWTGNPEFDVIAPNQPENVGAVPATYYNLVTWTDVSGESDELYHVYASMNADVIPGADGTELIASNVLEGSQASVHYLNYPLVDSDVSYYYGIVCVDASGNESEISTSGSSITNTARGIPTISLEVPSNFMADGDISEWEDAGIMPFVINPTTGHVATGTVSDENDLSATVYMAIDDDYLYYAADVIDDSYSYGDGDWWNQDALQLFIGLYDLRGPKHSAIMRGEEPDYILYTTESTLHLDVPGGGPLSNTGDGDFYFEGFDPDYATEGRISLDSLAAVGDTRFHPVNGMRIPIDIYFHDNDNGTWEGNIGFSNLGTDQQWNNPGEWAYTWIGDQAMTVAVDDGNNKLLADEFVLFPNFPNPFNPSTMIQFSLPKDQIVSLNIYNINGQLVESLVNQKLKAGMHQVDWNASGFASGMYIYQLQSSERSITQKMVLMK